MTDPFDMPGPLESIKWGDYTGRLLLIYPLRIERQQNFDKTGERDVTFADVHVIDGPGSPVVVYGTPVYPAYVQGQLRATVGTGRAVLGRLGQDTTRQERGKTAPWVLGDPTAADVQTARNYLAGAQVSAATSTPATHDEPPF